MWIKQTGEIWFWWYPNEIMLVVLDVSFIPAYFGMNMSVRKGILGLPPHVEWWSFINNYRFHSEKSLVVVEFMFGTKADIHYDNMWSDWWVYISPLLWIIKWRLLTNHGWSVKFHNFDINIQSAYWKALSHFWILLRDWHRCCPAPSLNCPFSKASPEQQSLLLL